MNQTLIDGMQGLGDNFYQFPVVRELVKTRKVVLRTPWPQIYKGLPNLTFTKPETTLRTQLKNMARCSEMFQPYPIGLPAVKLTYVPYQRRGVPIYQGLMRSMGFTFSYRLKVRDTVENRGEYAVIRPVTIRQEWKALSRNPKPEYIQQAVDHLNAKGIETVLVADIKPPDEIYEGPMIYRATSYADRGEYDLEGLVDLIHGAKIVIGGPGFIVPMCIALGTPAVIIHGGAGGWNNPEIINAPGEGKVNHVLPKNYCGCQEKEHHCPKSIEPERIIAEIDKLV